jgi:O-antigen ligase
MIFWKTILPENVVERINQTKTEEGDYDASLQHRLKLWEKGISLFKKNPVLGAGFNVIPILGIYVEDSSIVYRDTHNVFIKIMAEQGLIGLIVLMVILWKALKNGWILYRSSNSGFLTGLGFGFTISVISLLITNIFGDRWTHLQVGAYFWIFLGLVVSALKVTQQENDCMEAGKA